MTTVDTSIDARTKERMSWYHDADETLQRKYATKEVLSDFIERGEHSIVLLWMLEHATFE